LDRSILDFERSWITMKGPKDREIEAVLGLSTENYYDRLRFLAFDRGANLYDPMTIQRLRAFMNLEIGVEAAG
jgi:Protein of unknown function (DUF3263)